MGNSQGVEDLKVKTSFILPDNIATNITSQDDNIINEFNRRLGRKPHIKSNHDLIDNAHPLKVEANMKLSYSTSIQLRHR